MGKEDSKHKIYYKLVDKILDSDPILFKWYKENKTAEQIASELWITKSMVDHRIQRSKQKIIDLYNQLLESNYDLDTVVMNDSKYVECLLQRGIENPRTYIKFTKYYFPELLDKIEKQHNVYFSSIDYLIEKDEMLYKFFYEYKSLKEISNELDLNYQVVVDRMNRSKPKIRKLYEEYSKHTVNINKR